MGYVLRDPAGKGGATQGFNNLNIGARTPPHRYLGSLQRRLAVAGNGAIGACGGPIISAVMGLGMLFAVIAAAAAATALVSGMAARARDLALLRALGAHPWEMSIIALTEAGLLAAGAAILGIGLAYLFGAIAANFLADQTGIIFSPSPNLNDAFWIMVGAALAACAAAALPALRAAHAPIETVLNA